MQIGLAGKQTLYEIFPERTINAMRTYARLNWDCVLECNAIPAVNDTMAMLTSRQSVLDGRVNWKEESTGWWEYWKSVIESEKEKESFNSRLFPFHKFTSQIFL